MLAVVLGRRRADEVDLLTAGIQPGPGKVEVGPIVAGDQTQLTRVKGQGGLDVVDVERNVVHALWLHGRRPPAEGQPMDWEL